MYLTENRVYKIVIKDTNDDIISPSVITDMRIVIYNDVIKKRALYYTKVSDGTENGLITVDGDAHKFTILSDDTKDLKPGRYIIQIRYDADDGSIPEEDRINISDRELFIIRPVIE